MKVRKKNMIMRGIRWLAAVTDPAAVLYAESTQDVINGVNCASNLCVYEFLCVPILHHLKI